MMKYKQEMSWLIGADASWIHLKHNATAKAYINICHYDNTYVILRLSKYATPSNELLPGMHFGTVTYDSCISK